MIKKHPLFNTLKNLTGNARGCVYTEPLWGIPFNLYGPYVSVYMLALGLRDSQIGLLTSFSMIMQVFWTVMSGAITDKLGRKRTTLIFDLISWSVPCLIWAFAQDYRYFIAGAIVNSVWRVTHNSWNCLLVEDTDPDLIVDIWSWISISGLIAAFFSPLTGLFIAQFDLIPTIRGLYLFSFVMMTSKFVATNAMVTETKQGYIRMQETKSQPLFFVLQGMPGIVKQILKSKGTLLAASLMLVLVITRMITGTFWSILVTEKLDLPAEHIALFPFIRSITMLATYFMILPRIRQLHTGVIIAAGFTGLIVSTSILILTPPRQYWMLLAAVMLEACSLPMVSTLIEKIMVVTVNAQERARIMAVLNAAILLITSPFGWLSGRLSEINKRYPFVLSLILFALGIIFAHLATRATQTKDNIESASFQASS